MKKPGNASNQIKTSIWRKMTTPNYKWEEKDDFLDVIYWTRQILAVFQGLIWGYFGVTGFLGFASFIALNSLAVLLYSSKFKSNFDNDEAMDYVKEGFMTCFAGFMVTWIMAYSATYF